MVLPTYFFFSLSHFFTHLSKSSFGPPCASALPLPLTQYGHGEHTTAGFGVLGGVSKPQFTRLVTLTLYSKTDDEIFKLGLFCPSNK